MTEIRSISDTFTAPAVSVNAFNKLFHRDELYFAIFRPDPNMRWSGNLKRYKIGVNNGQFAVLDKNNNPAVDPNTGFFSEGSTSVWTDMTEDVPDGGAPEKGGAAGELRTPATRKLYTYTGNYATTGTTNLSDVANIEPISSNGRRAWMSVTKTLTATLPRPVGTWAIRCTRIRCW